MFHNEKRSNTETRTQNIPQVKDSYILALYKQKTHIELIVSDGIRMMDLDMELDGIGWYWMVLDGIGHNV